jgi:hypothetical protein
MSCVILLDQFKIDTADQQPLYPREGDQQGVVRKEKYDLFV